MILIHQIFGFTLDEWASMVGIFGGIGTLFVFLAHILKSNIRDPIESISHQVDKLQNVIDKIADQAQMGDMRLSKQIAKVQEDSIDYDQRLTELEKFRDKALDFVSKLKSK